MSTRINSESRAHNLAMRGGMGAVTSVSRVSQIAWFENYDEAVAFARDWAALDNGAHAVELTDYYTGDVWQTVEHSPVTECPNHETIDSLFDCDECAEILS